MYFPVVFNSQRFGTLSDCLGAEKKIVFNIHNAAACSDIQIYDDANVTGHMSIS